MHIVLMGPIILDWNYLSLHSFLKIQPYVNKVLLSMSNSIKAAVSKIYVNIYN